MTSCQKHLFSIPDHVTYLNCAYMSPLPKSVEKAGIIGVQQKSRPWEVGSNDFFEPIEKVKKLFAKLVNVKDPERIAIIPSVSYGLANAVKNIHPSPGSNIILLEEQFPSNVYSWKRLAHDHDCEIRTIKPPSSFEKRGEKWNTEILSNIDAATVAVAMPHSHWADGTLFDLVAIRQRTNEVGAKLIIDGTQSVGALPFDVEKIQPDALICAGYKWMLGPYAFGLAYFAPFFDDGTPIEENWINRHDSQDFQNLVNYQPLYKPASHRYSVGENSHFIASPMMQTALQLLLEWGQDNIQSYCKKITLPTLQLLQEKGFWIENEYQRSHHIFGIRLPQNMDLETIKKKAAAENIFVSFRGNAIRVSPHLYNTEADFEKLGNILVDF